MATRISAVLGLALALSSSAPPLHAQDVLDAQVQKGLQQLEAGDTAGAILTLHEAARRLATVSRPRALAQAYVYLGAAYLAEGQETLAKARFRDAVLQSSLIALDAKRYPRAAELLEEARRDAAARGFGGGGGSRKKRALIGGAAVAAGAAAIAVTAADKPDVDFNRYYGTFPNLTFTPAGNSGCPLMVGTLELSGNSDGSNFRINQLLPPIGTPPIQLTGTIEATGHFSATGGGYAILGQSIGTRVAGSETRQVGGCVWSFDGTR
jgi:hypothetical protein